MVKWRVGLLCLIAGVQSFFMTSQPLEAKAKYGVQELDPTQQGVVDGVGIASRDIASMADIAIRDLLTRPDIVNRPIPPRIVVEGEFFRNQSSQRIDRDMITDSLRVQLNRAAAGRLRFVNRETLMAVDRERSLKDEGVTDGGTTARRQMMAADYQLIGKITSLDARNTGSGTYQRRTQIIFELLDLETTEIVWTGEPYVILRASDEDIVNQ